jgi:hypothetical protein
METKLTIYLSNPGELDLNTIRIMGVSVKTGDTPIGYFGTGMKYAIATLLRTGHEVALSVGSKNYKFTARDTTIRGEKFKLVHMNDEPLSFTTELGKNWEVWQAFRELYSNMLDEGGTAGTKPVKNDTVISVKGADFTNCYHTRGDIFLDSHPSQTVDGLEIHPMPSRYVFYRGVRALTLPKASALTYNILTQTELTEDRTIKSAWDVQYKVETRLPQVRDTNIATVVVRGGDFWENDLDFSNAYSMSQEFMDVARANASNANMNSGIRRLVERSNKELATFPEVTASTDEVETLRNVFSILEYAGCDLDLYEVTLCETLGPNIMGLYHIAKNQVYLSREALMRGSNYAAMVLYEEWLHKRHKLKDNSRAMQTFLLGKIISQASGSDV